eukprot:363951-Chlamydomonas_euryale.AAC.3
MQPVSRTASRDTLPVSLSRSLPARSTSTNLPYLSCTVQCSVDRVVCRVVRGGGVACVGARGGDCGVDGGPKTTAAVGVDVGAVAQDDKETGEEVGPKSALEATAGGRGLRQALVAGAGERRWRQALAAGVGSTTTSFELINDHRQPSRKLPCAHAGVERDAQGFRLTLRSRQT